MQDKVVAHGEINIFPAPPPVALGAEEPSSEDEGPDEVNEAVLLSIPDAAAYDTQVLHLFEPTVFVSATSVASVFLLRARA